MRNQIQVRASNKNLQRLWQLEKQRSFLVDKFWRKKLDSIYLEIRANWGEGSRTSGGKVLTQRI